MSEDFGAVLGASSMIRTMADGTFRIQVDVEPRFAQQAFALFGAPGTPIALARITNEAAVAEDRKEAEKPKGGALAKLAGMWCTEPVFWDWLRADGWASDEAMNADKAAQAVRKICFVESRAELDTDESAKRMFDERIRGPYSKYRARVGA